MCSRSLSEPPVNDLDWSLCVFHVVHLFLVIVANMKLKCKTVGGATWEAEVEPADTVWASEHVELAIAMRILAGCQGA